MSATDAAIAATELLQGTFSIAGRSSEHGIQALRKFVDVPAEDAPAPEPSQEGRGSPQRPPRRKGAARAARPEGAAKDPWNAKEPQGELARAVQERLRLKAQLRAAASESQLGKGGDADAGHAADGHPSAAFASQGIDDGPWSSKFTASMSNGALNRWKGEERPDPGWYKVQYGLVHPRVPAADLHDRRSYSPRPPQEVEGAFLTGVDCFTEPSPPPMDATMRSTADFASSNFGGTAMSLNTGRCCLTKLGRNQLTVNDISCPAEDALQQDVKGYHKLRAPSWDFSKNAPRPPLLQGGEDISAPGKYDVRWGNGVTSAAPRTGIPFDKGLTRAASMGQLGHGAFPAVLLPEGVRSPGTVVVPDRSRAKDAVRRRVTHVGGFAADAPRPDYTVGCQEFHDTTNPAICAEVFRRQLTFDADQADRARRARVVVRDFGGMAERGRVAVQGVRALQDDTAIRGAVGLGFVETASQLSATDPGFGAQSPSRGPTGSRRTERRESPLRRRAIAPVGAAAYQRQAPAPGFCARAPKAPGARSRRVPQGHAAMPGWSTEVLGAAGAE